MSSAARANRLSPAPLRALRETTFMGWPAFALEQAGLSLHVVPSIGGRLMGIALEGDELCFVNPLLRGRHARGDTNEDTSDDVNDGANDTANHDASTWADLCGAWAFPLWGGGKTWLAPESAWPGGAPHRDLDSGAWAVTHTWFDDHGMGIHLQSPLCRDSGLQLQRRLSLPGDGTAWRIEHSVHNRGRAAWHGGLWDVLMLRRPARVSVSLPAAHAAHWPAAVCCLPGKGSVAALCRSGVLMPERDRIEIVCAEAGEFKLGFDSDSGAVQAELPGASGALRYQRRSALPAAARYAHGHPLEVFNAPALPYFEIESHSPATTLQPGEHMRFVIDEAVFRLPPPTSLEGTHT